MSYGRDIANESCDNRIRTRSTCHEKREEAEEAEMRKHELEEAERIKRMKEAQGEAKNIERTVDFQMLFERIFKHIDI